MMKPPALYCIKEMEIHMYYVLYLGCTLLCFLAKILGFPGTVNELQLQILSSFTPIYQINP